jgi:hypothetical protein
MEIMEGPKLVWLAKSTPEFYRSRRVKRRDRLLDLFLKILRKSGIVSANEEKNRDHYRNEFRKICATGEVWFLDDASGAITLGHYDPQRDEIVAIGTRDGMERQGHADRFLHLRSDPACPTTPSRQSA